MTKKQEEDKQQAIDTLKKYLKPGDTVYTKVEHVARSGMSRHISVYVTKDGVIEDITWLVARATGMRMSDKTGGLVVGGCGMDMTFHVVYCLGRAVYRDGVPCTGSNGRDGGVRCQSSDHNNKPDMKFDKSIIHHDSGYAFKNRNL